MVPLQVANSIDQLQRIQTLIVGGGQVSDDLSKKLAQLKTKVFATYGMTETITHVALSPVNKAAGRKDDQLVFTALAGIHFSTDQRGCLIISAPSISSSEVVTNDIVKLVSDSSFIWLGRYDHVINSGGLKLLPELIETKYKNLIDTDFFVFGMPDKVLGEKLVLFVEGEKRSNLFKEIKDFQKQHSHDLSKYEIPKEVMFAKNFIRTETGKVNRKQTVAALLARGNDRD
jgi:O-succinylbenzoic acid--CoA ligase